MRQESHWEKLLAPLFEKSPYDCAGVEYISGGKKPCLRVFIDKEGGIGIDDITRLTREISLFLDVESNLDSAYTLEVSSPGLDRTLFKPSQFHAQIGKEISITLSEPIEDHRRFRGRLLSVFENTFEMDCDGQVRCFSFHAVDKAKLIPKYSFKAKDKGQDNE